MTLEAYLYQTLDEAEELTYLLKHQVDSCMITPSISVLMDRVRPTKCVYTLDYLTAESDLEVIIDPSKYYALKGQLVNPVLKIPKDERSKLAGMLNRKDCIIRVK